MKWTSKGLASILVISFLSITAITVPQAALASSSLLTGLQAYYQLEGNADDSTSNANNGSLIGSPAFGTAYGKIKQGLSIPSTSGNLVSVPDSASLDFTSGLSICGWINPQQSGNEMYIAVKTRASPWSSGGGAQWFIRINAANGAWAMDINTGSTIPISGSYTFNVGTWYFLCGTWDGSTMEVYVNGVSQGTKALSGSINTGAYPLYIGNNNISGDQPSGQAKYVDEIGIWSRALTSTEISQLYNSGAGLSYPFGGATPVYDIITSWVTWIF